MFIEVRRKDWAESFVHHIVTLGLEYYAFYANFTRSGIMVMLIHDVSDIFLEAAKVKACAIACFCQPACLPQKLVCRRCRVLVL